MVQEGRGKKSSSPDSIFEIDEFDTNWDEPSGIELMREPSVQPEAGSEIQAASQPPRAAELCAEEETAELGEPGFEEALPLIHPDAELAQAARVESLLRRGAGVTPLSRARAPSSERQTAPGDPLLNEVRDRYAMGDYSGALVVAEGILQGDADNAQARRYADNCRQVLEQMYCAKLGPLSQRPEVAVSGDQLRWLSLDHRAGFLLSLIDGTSSMDELLDISGMPRFEALRTLCDLLEQNVITLTNY